MMYGFVTYVRYTHCVHLPVGLNITLQVANVLAACESRFKLTFVSSANEIAFTCKGNVVSDYLQQNTYSIKIHLV